MQCSVAVEFICIFVAALGTRKETRAVLRCAALQLTFFFCVCVRVFLVWRAPSHCASLLCTARDRAALHCTALCAFTSCMLIVPFAVLLLYLPRYFRVAVGVRGVPHPFLPLPSVGSAYPTLVPPRIFATLSPRGAVRPSRLSARRSKGKGWRYWGPLCYAMALFSWTWMWVASRRAAAAIAFTVVFFPHSTVAFVAFCMQCSSGHVQ